MAVTRYKKAVRFLIYDKRPGKVLYERGLY